jgi:hypothetical protein
MSLFISSVFTYDEDAGNYIQAVETADEIASPGIGALEPATRSAINKFVVGCKTDGIWTAIKASCILAGARTLAGALVPLVGTAPTNNGFIGVGTDYVRKTGLVGNGTTKYLDSNASALSTGISQDNHSFSVYISSLGSVTAGLIDLGRGAAGAIGIHQGPPNFAIRSASGTLINRSQTSGFVGLARASSSIFTSRLASSNEPHSVASQSLRAGAVALYRFSEGGQLYSNARLAFYSIGESLDLALLDARVTDLINAFAVTIP